MKYIIGSRGSRLALIQTKYVQEKLAKAYPEHTFEIQIIKTKGDKIQNKPLDKIGGKGLFVKEIEEKIISEEIHHCFLEAFFVDSIAFFFKDLFGKIKRESVSIIKFECIFSGKSFFSGTESEVP